jgi:hypothetical protein
MSIYRFPELKSNEQRGSKPRCHLLTDGSPEQVSKRLTDLIKPWGKVDVTDRWMPHGFEDITEAQLGKKDNLLGPTVGKSLVNWWLAVSEGRVPHWDIASTCTIEGSPGLLLVEAKAYDGELIEAEAGKTYDKEESEGSRRNRLQIASCMEEANVSLSAQTKVKTPWALSIEHHYQMSNRFAWSWKLTELGFPVVLIYLGFLNAEEMRDKGLPFGDYRSWERLVLSHSDPLFDETIWDQRWLLNGKPFIPLIKSYQQSLDR